MDRFYIAVCLFFIVSASSHASPISYEQTYPTIPLSSSYIGLDFVTQLQPSTHGTAFANGTEALPTNDGSFLVFDRQSNVYKVAANGTQSLLLDSKTAIGANYINNGSQRGLQYAVAHPDYATAGAQGENKLYTTTTESANPNTVAKLFALPTDLGLTPAHYDVVSEWDLSGPTPTREVLMVIETPRGDHNARWLGFGPEGSLHIGVGDGGNTYWNPGDTVGEYGFGQRTDSPLGSILKINVPGDGTYSVPADNPFLNEPNAVDEVYARGLRNPQQCWWDNSDNLYCADIGQKLAEEVNLITPGGNYGWNKREGDYCVVADNEELADVCAADPNFISSLFAYAHINNNSGLENRAIGGVAVCEGCGIDILEGHIIATDLATGSLFGFNTASNQLFEYLFQDLTTGLTGSYTDLTGTTRVEARLGQCGDAICYSSRRDDNVFRLTNAIAVHAHATGFASALLVFLVLARVKRQRNYN